MAVRRQLPDIPERVEHCLHFGTAGHRPSASAVQTLGAAFGLSRQRVGKIVTEVTDAIVGWRSRFEAHGVAAADCRRGIERRLGAYRQP